jgi:hypothetical protein
MRDTKLQVILEHEMRNIFSTADTLDDLRILKSEAIIALNYLFAQRANEVAEKIAGRPAATVTTQQNTIHQ